MLTQSVGRHVGAPAADVVQDARPVGLWLDANVMADSGVTAEGISDYLLGYTLADNVAPGQEVPEQYGDELSEPLFAAAFPSDRMSEILRCAEKKG